VRRIGEIVKGFKSRVDRLDRRIWPPATTQLHLADRTDTTPTFTSYLPTFTRAYTSYFTITPLDIETDIPPVLVDPLWIY
jgi:hypothetical protein